MPKKFATVALHLVMLAVVCTIAAYWAIRIMTPVPTSSPPLQSAAGPREADPVLAARMFGLVQAAPVQLALNVEVVGVFAAGGDSAAVLAVDGKPARAYLLDQEVAPGAKLAVVTKDGVTIERVGVRQEFAVPPRQDLSLGGPPVAPGFTREGNTLTAPTVAGPGGPVGVPTPRPPPQQFVPPPQPGVPQPGVPQQLQPQPQQNPAPLESPRLGPSMRQ